jgi:hypothetical protein
VFTSAVPTVCPSVKGVAGLKALFNAAADSPLSFTTMSSMWSRRLFLPTLSIEIFAGSTVRSNTSFRLTAPSFSFTAADMWGSASSTIRGLRSLKVVVGSENWMPPTCEMLPVAPVIVFPFLASTTRPFVIGNSRTPRLGALAGARACSVGASAARAAPKAGSTVSVVAPRLTLSPFAGPWPFDFPGLAATPTEPNASAAMTSAMSATTSRGAFLESEIGPTSFSVFDDLNAREPSRFHGCVKNQWRHARDNRRYRRAVGPKEIGMTNGSEKRGRLYAATGDAIARLDQAGGEWTAELSLRGSGAQCLAVDPADPDSVYAGLREGGVQRTGDGGRRWVDCALPQAAVFSLAVSPADGAVYAGTEPSALYRSDDRGETWRELDGLLELPSRPTWSFPPGPWTSHVRWIAPSPQDADVILVGIELGGLMRSTDGGETWQDHPPGAQPDVHSLAWHPRAPRRAYEAGGGGAAWSRDAGETWRPADEGRDRHYTWSVAVDPDDPELWYLSASTGPFAAHGRGDPQAHIYRREGGEWRPADRGFPDPIPAMPYALVSTNGRLFAGLADGQIWESVDRAQSWRACTVQGDAPTRLHALAYAR